MVASRHWPLVGLLACVAPCARGRNNGAYPSVSAEPLLPAHAVKYPAVTTYPGGRYGVWGSILGLLVRGLGFSRLAPIVKPFCVQRVLDSGVPPMVVLAGRLKARHVPR